MLRWTTLALLAACGRIGFESAANDLLDELPDGVRGGTRLNVRRLVDETGHASFDTFFDTELDTACVFRDAANGGFRCFPYGAGATLDLFVDASCTRRGVRTGSLRGACEPVHFANDIRDIREVYALGSPVSVAYRLVAPGTCVLDPGLEPGLVYELGSLVGPTTFVGATAKEVRVSARFSYEQLEADDGARMLTGRLVDHALGITCQPEPPYLGQEDPRCAPVPNFSRLYLDGACTQSVFLTYEPVTEGTLFGAYGDHYNALACEEPTYHRARAPQFASTLYAYNHARGGGCIEYLGGPSWVTEADELARDELAAGRFDTSAGRITHPVWSTEDGVTLPYMSGLYDRTLGAPCGVVWTNDVQRRCIPVPIGSGWAYLDSSCATEPVSTYGSCGSSVGYGLTVDAPTAGGPSCGNFLYTVSGAAPSVALYGRRTPDRACEPLGRVGSQTPGPALAPSVFSTMQSRDDAP